MAMKGAQDDTVNAETQAAAVGNFIGIIKTAHQGATKKNSNVNLGNSGIPIWLPIPIFALNAAAATTQQPGSVRMTEEGDRF